MTCSLVGKHAYTCLMWDDSQLTVIFALLCTSNSCMKFYLVIPKVVLECCSVIVCCVCLFKKLCNVLSLRTYVLVYVIFSCSYMKASMQS